MSYMPAVAVLLAPDLEEGEDVHPERVPLYLPSGVLSELAISNTLVKMEAKLRLAQADDALAELRRLLRILQGLLEYKYTQLGPSQRANTRARSMISQFNQKIDQCAERYRAAWTALGILDPEGSWTQKFFQLKKEHVKTLGRNLDEESEGRRETSWIWMMRPELGPEDVASEEEMSESE